MGKTVKFAKAFGMQRCQLGYITVEQLVFGLQDDEAKNKKTIAEFAKKYKCELVEVWYREDEKWDEVVFHKAYTFHKAKTEESFNKLDIYRKR
jgi:hypothetical protein